MSKVLPTDIIASYPRSGLNWVRYCIEYFSGQRTPGRPLLHSSGPMVIDRSHDLAGTSWWGPTVWPTLFDETGVPRYQRLVLLLRNYKEGLACEGMNDFARMGPYCANVLAWQRFAGPRFVVHYEDLLSDFAWMERILDFLGIEHTWQGFDLDLHRARSQLFYHARRIAHTREDPLDFTFHSRRLAPERRAEADIWFRQQLGGELYQLLLARYHESQQEYR